MSDQTSERRDNSVLIALKELRGMEDARVKREQEETRARLDAERAAKEAVVRQAHEQEEARKRAEEDKVRAAEQERQNRLREDQLRVEEAERRARVEGEMKLQEERMRLEIQSRSHHRSPVKAVVAAVAGVALIGGVLLYRMNSQRQAEQAVAAHEREVADQKARAADERAKTRELEFRAQLAGIKQEMDERMRTARSDAERAKIRADADAKRADAEQSVGKGQTRGKKAGGDSSPTTKAPKYKDPGKRDINDDILNGL